MLTKLQSRVRAVSIAAVVPLLAAAPAFAQAVGDPFQTAVTDITAKIGVYGAALAGIAAAAVVFRLAVKYIKRLPSAG